MVTDTEKGDVDYGNYLYGILYHITVFYGRRHSEPIKSLYEQVKRRYPTLDMNHVYTKQSLVMQGDVIEVALAIASDTRQDTFMREMRKFPMEFDKILYWIDDARDNGYLKVSKRPPPSVLARAILMAPWGGHARNHM